MKKIYFQLGWTPELDPDIEGERLYSIPRVKCPKCGESRATSHCYPWLDIEKLFDKKTLSRLRTDDEPRDYSWEEFEMHRDVIRSHLGHDYPVASWTSFGQFSGKIYKNPADIICTLESYLFIKSSAIKLLEKDGFNFKTFIPLLKGAEEDYLEVWVPPLGLSPDHKYCSECNRGGTKFKGVLKAESIPEGTHFFRLKNNPNFLNFSVEFYAAAKKNGLKGLFLAKEVQAFFGNDDGR